jgi:hypothetical protein
MANTYTNNLRRLLRNWTRDIRRPLNRSSSRRGRLQLEQLEARCVPATHTYIVTTTAYSADISHLTFNSKGIAVNNNGAPVSLFEALTAINAVNAKTGQYAYPGSSEIDFNLPGHGVHVFALPASVTNLHALIAQGNTTINGYSQPGASPNTKTGASDNASIAIQLRFALNVTGSNTIIRGIALPAITLGSGQGNQVLGDFIGVTPGGASMHSSLAGVTIGTPGQTANHATHDTVGTPAAADRNVISGHQGAAGNGVAIVGGSSNNSMQNNLIGTSLAGAAAIGNAQAGVYFDASATAANLVAGNIIAFNHGAGIQMAGGAQAHFTKNAIFSNGGGITLVSTANAGIAAPVFTAWNPTTVSGRLTKFTPGATYMLDFYNNTATDGAGHYEGQTPWATVKVVPNNQGVFSASVAEPTFGGLTATVTDALGNTSAFSAATDFNIMAASGSTLSFSEGTPATNFLIGTIIRDGNPNMTLSLLQAVVSWGDGTHATLTSQPSAAGQIVLAPGGAIQVRGSHTYAAAGNYRIAATVTDKATYASNSGINTLAQVAAAPLTSASAVINPVAFVPFQGLVATFTEKNPTAKASQFTATIKWGDGTTTTGTITATAATPAGANFNVIGSHMYTMAGQFPVAVTIKDADGGTTSTSRNTTVAFGALTPLSVAIHATEGTPFTGTVGMFGAPGAGPTTQYSAVITWGDGHTTTASTAAGTITPVPTAAGAAPGSPPSAPEFAITGMNTYIAAGTDPVSIVVTGPGSATTTIHSTATVWNAPLNSTSVAINPVLGAAFNGVVATFTEKNPSATAGQFTALINWGDGTTTTGAISAGTSGPSGATTFNVSGGHTYLAPGTYPVTVLVTDANGGATSTQLNTTVSPLMPTNGTSINTTAEESFNGIIGSFVDTDTQNAASTSFTAVITWGDGQTSTASTAAGTIQLSGTNQFTILGTNTYATAGTYPIGIVVTGPGSATTPISSTANVTAPALTGATQAIQAFAGTLLTVPVATFTDAAGPQPLGAYTATINWGDGTPQSTGIISVNGNTFTVTGSHTYASVGTPTVAVQITDTAGATLMLWPQATVQTPPPGGSGSA